jgi:hypothetical protein
MRFYRGNLIVGTPWQKMLCISLCLVAFSPPAFSAPTTPPDEPTPAKKQAADKTSPAVESEAGPTFPNPVASDGSKSKVLPKAQPLESDESKGPSAQDESAQDESAQDESAQDESKPTDQPVIEPVTELQTPNFDEHVPLINDDILLAPDPYLPTCKSGGRCKKQCKQCRQCTCSRCSCDHDTYLLVDFLFFKRNNATNGAVVAETTSVNPVPKLTTRSTNPGTAPGIRLFGGRLRKNGVGWEFGYTGVFGMFGERTARGSGDLRVPGALGPAVSWTNLDSVRSTYTSSLNMCEVNIFTSRATIKSDPDSRFPWRRIHDPLGANVTSEYEFQCLGGFRWAGFNDVANLHVDASQPTNNDGTYSITTNSQMLGPQIGFKTKRRWSNWSIQGWTKATLAGTFLNADSAPIETLAGGIPYRSQISARDVGVGFIGDMNYSLVRRLNDNWSLRAGYNLIWISGVALAPNQFDFTNTTTSGTTLANTGNVFLHGANLGFEAQW